MTAEAADGELASVWQLSVRYASAVDGRDGETFASLFEPDGELVVPAYPDDLRPVVTRRGHDQLRRVPGGLERYARTFHQVSNPLFEIDGEEASGTVTCVAHHLDATSPPTDTVWFIRYEDLYRRRDGRWRFRRRVLHLEFVETHEVDRIADP